MLLKEKYNKVKDGLCKKTFFAKFFALPVINKIFEYEVFSYLVFGVLTTVVNFVTYLLVNLPFGDTYEKVALFNLSGFVFKWIYVANFIAWAVSVAFAFVTNKLFVFEKSDNSLIKEILTFVGARVISFLVFEEGLFGLLSAAFSFFTGGSWIAKIISAVAVVIFNYVAGKFVVFKKNEKHN